MITLIAESKTMSAKQPDSLENDLLTIPLFKTDADATANLFASMPVEEIAERLTISLPLATKAKRLFYDFKDYSIGEVALTAFTGEVFRALDLSNLPKDTIDFAYKKLNIISSLYGLLRPTDLIKPYRFDFNIENPSLGETMQKFWKPTLTIAFVKMIKESGEKEVLDLLPAEATKCLDWKIIKRFAKVMKINFKSIAQNGQLKTPHTGKIKELRGKLLREILINRLDSTSDILQIHTPLFVIDEDASKKDYPTFITL